MALIDFAAAIRGIDGNAMQEPARDGSGTKDVLLKDIAVFALLQPSVGADGRVREVEPVEKVRLAALAQHIFTASRPLDLKVEEIAMIKSRIGSAVHDYMAVFSALKLLDPSE